MSKYKAKSLNQPLSREGNGVRRTRITKVENVGLDNNSLLIYCRAPLPRECHTATVFDKEEAGRIMSDYEASYTSELINRPVDALYIEHILTDVRHPSRGFDVEEVRGYNAFG